MPKTTDAGPPAPLFLSVAEAARLLGYTSKEPVYDLIYAGTLPATQLKERGDLRIPRAAFEEFCARLEADARTRFGGAA